ncbi:glycogen/starch/alpha-glucan phosphorylase [Streptococcus merionis]|uniref:glycogen/starch/alpha-glucan phosphorylase n=1 Tax=Streptococcus merionis TaxID=400065 RepID=UPI0026EC124B|nr:glycogen/starch/alpha-glucan phosphorylase [Streptococcus merionis]
MLNLQQLVQETYAKRIEDCNNEELYYALLSLTQRASDILATNNQKKKVYYISAEFLIGKLLSNNLINLGLYAEVKDQLAEAGKDLLQIEEVEMEPSLGNGGLGRLAACFLDSIATLGLNGDGVGLNYHFGLFQQLFEDNQQKAVPNPWITPESWLKPSKISYEVPFANFTLTSKLYDIDVPGYKTATKNRLRLFDLGSVDDNIIYDGIEFDKPDIFRNLTLFLYPDDSTREGELLRIFQQYFMVSNAAQLLIDEAVAKGSNLYDLADYAVVQINDTHPSLVIPELIRLLTERGIDFDKAVEIVSSMTAYTNHTILAEALEKWPLDFLNEVVPHLVPIIEELDRRVKETYHNDSVNIIDEQGRVHMAHMDMHYGFSVNGVAALHTDILKSSELKPFYDIYPEKFNNKTNGITFRRWLMHANPRLAKYLDELLGHGYHHDATELEKFLEFKGNADVKAKLESIKKHNKRKLQAHLEAMQGVTINPNAIFDIQIKRMHEYKRQQMNVLYVINKYLDIKAGNVPSTPITVFFGGKAAPAYTIAQDVIHLILALSQVIANDPEVSPHLQLVMVENYNVTAASFLIPAADISEQISLASKEASGTGNMKFMLNGALTLGTEDGANVEIHELVGSENIYIFGEDSQTVIDTYANKSYVSRDFYERPNIKPLIDFIVSDEVRQYGNDERLFRLHNELINKDWFMTLLDLESYIDMKEKMLKDYEDRDAWLDKVIVNIAKAGFFSSDRTIAEYNRDIWKLEAAK